MCRLALLFFLISSCFAQELRLLPFLKDYTAERAGSWDRTGANDDGGSRNPLQPKETRTLAELEGPGILTHMWFTIATQERYHLKRLVLRIHWDGEPLPAVEAPIGDFFGLGLGEYFLWESGPLSAGSQKALNCFFPMPFRKSARITITHEGEMPVRSFYYNFDWEKHRSLPENTAYFHAEYRQATPNKGWTDDWSRNGEEKVNSKPNLDGKDNYVIVEAEGRGHFIGVVHSILQNQGDWWGEGDEMIFIDDFSKPRITGTGSEDYYLGAWCYGNCGISPFGSSRPTFSYQRYGNPVNGGDHRGAGWMVYRFHTESPIPFTERFKMTIEHGHANHRSDNFYTVAYWYQTGPHRKRAPLPPVEDRIPRMFNTGGPTTGRP
ncbi:MAG: DUF2961 domain-containing protein [Acidobacteria bacterium]|nr:DUF2961 domain-containing protein [Acidobacteriota bacterium]